MKLKLFLLSFLICSNLYAVQTEKYITKNDDDSLILTAYVPGSNKPIEQVLKDNGMDKKVSFQVMESKLPKEDQKYWRLSGSKIMVDEDAKQADLDAQAKEQEEKDALLKKLDLTPEQAELLKK